MTKVIILGEERQEEKELKPIEVTHFINSLNGSWGEIGKYLSSEILSGFDFIELVSENYLADGRSLMFAYEKGDRVNGTLYIGHFNDGVV